MPVDPTTMNTLVIGKAKTGTTALAMLMKRETGAKTLHMEPKGILDFVSDIPEQNNYVTKIIFEHFRGRYRHLNAIIHNELYAHYNRVVLIKRDFRDEMLSRLMYLSKVLSNKNHPAERWYAWIDVLRAKEADPQSLSFRTVCDRFNEIFNVNAWHDLTQTHTESEREYRHFIASSLRRPHHVVSYENMMDNKLGGLEAYLDFKLQSSTSEVELGQYSYTKRSGSYGGWRQFFIESDVEEIRQLLNNRGLNTYRDWNLNPVTSLNPQDYSEYVRRMCGLADAPRLGTSPAGAQAGNLASRAPFH